MGDQWWGTGGGDFRDTIQRNNYVIHPPVDQLPQSAPGGSSPDGARLSQVVHRPTGSAGTAAAYMPNQYFVSSTTPNVKFELRGGHWSEDNSGGQDRYDRDQANVDGIVDLSKKHGFLSPVYYEVYQLSNGGPRDGRLLGVINPRDRNIFPTTDNQPNSNDGCKYSNGANGPCWRTFEINAPGGPSSAITNRITLDGSAQDSCDGRYGGSDPCFNVRRDSNKSHVHEADHVWVVRQNDSRSHEHGSGDTPHSHHNPGSATGDTSQLNRNDNAHDQFNTHPSNHQSGGNCFWEWNSPNTLAGDDAGNWHSHRVFCAQFENNVPVDYGDPHSHPDGSGITDASPFQQFPGFYLLNPNKLLFYNRSPGNYEDGGNCFWGWDSHGDVPGSHTNKEHEHRVFCYDRTRGDSGTMSSANFSQVDSNARFLSSYYPNLNGNYVFLIKAVVFEDRFNGYVTHVNDIQRSGSWNNGCLTAAAFNTLRCPEIILRYAQSRNLSGPLVQNGYFLRTPKDLAGGKEFLASAPASIAFNISYGPVGGVANEPGQDHEYEEMAGQSYRGLRFQAGGAGCRNDDWSHRGPTGPTTGGGALFKAGNADWDDGPKGGFEGSPPGGDQNISAQVERVGTLNENNTLNTSGYNAPDGITRQVASGSISGTWQTYPGWAIFLDDPAGSGSPYNPLWRANEQLSGRLNIHHWNDGNNLAQGGAPFTWGYWPTCLATSDFSVTAHTPKAHASKYRYNGRENFNQMNNAGDAIIDFAFQYTLPETRGLVKHYVKVNQSSTGAEVARVDQSNTSVEPGTHQVRVPIQANSFSANTDYSWQACVNPGPVEKCTTAIKFRVNKGPVATIVSADPDNPTNTGNVNYNCSKLAIVLKDPENNQVRPYFAISWTKDGQTNVVTSFNRSGLNSDSWGGWLKNLGTFGYGSGNNRTYTSDDVRPVSWTVNGSSRSVPNKTLTQFLQEDVPEGADVTWTASGEDRFGASELPALPDLFRSRSTPQATVDSGYPIPISSQPTLNYRRFGPPVGATFHKNSRPNLLPPGSTKKFKDLNGAVVDSVTDGQTVQVETTLRNTGETPTKRYQIYDYLGSVRDFEPIQDNPQFPITVQYNNGTERRVQPTVSRVIPNRSNGFNDTPESLVSNGDDRQASYKLDFGTNPDQLNNVSVTKDGSDFNSCQFGSGANAYCLTNYAPYPNSVSFFCGGAGNLPGACGGTNNAPAVWSYQLDGVQPGLYDLTLGYYNRPNPDPNGTPPPGYDSYRVRVDYPGGSRTVDLPVESDNQANGLHTFTVSDLDITAANPTVTLTWNNDAWQNSSTNSSITLYEHINYGGRSLRLTGSTSSVVPNGFNDITSAVRVESNGLWEVCEHADYGGRCRVLDGDVGNFIPDGWNDILTSARLINTDANFGLNSLRLATAANSTSDSILRPGELGPNETIILRYWTRANRNWTTTSDSDQNSNFQRRLEVGSTSATPPAPQSDPKGGTIDIGDARTFLPYSEDYCNGNNPLINHTCNFKPGDVVAPWVRGHRGSIASNDSIFGYDPLAGENNATFLVQANGTLSHFSGTDSFGGYQAGQSGSVSCSDAGDIDWRQEMYRNIRKLLEGSYNSDAETRAMFNGASAKDVQPNGRPNVWVADGNLELNGDKTFRGVGTVIVKGDLTVNNDLRYQSVNDQLHSLGIIVLGNVHVKETVGNMVGTYYVSDINRNLAGQSNGCPDIDSANGAFTTGRSNRQLNVDGALIAKHFDFQRYYIDPSDSVADPAENVYYDGRVVASTPPGFSTFRDTAAWYEIVP
jgi:hypothetical protein